MLARPQPHREADSMPGPADYTADPSATKPSQPAFTIASRGREATADAADCTPGPGDFSVPDPPPAGPAYTIPGAARSPAKPRGYAPGPGDYDSAAPSVPEGPAYTIPQAAQGALAAGERGAEHLGPGAYDPQGPRGGPAFTMGCLVGERIVPGQAAPGAAEMPGPQDYEAVQLPRGPAFTLGVRHGAAERSAASAGIGPGAYEAPGVAAGPAFTIQVRPCVAIAAMTQLHRGSPVCKHHASMCTAASPPLPVHWLRDAAALQRDA